MALKATLTEDEYGALDPKIQELYKKSGDGYLLDAEGVEDVRGLKSTLEKLKAERKTLDGRIKELTDKWGDLDPEQARKALDELQKLADKKLMDEGKVEELLTQRLAARDKEHDRVVKNLEKKLEAELAARTAATRRLEEALIDNGLRTAAGKAGVRPAAMTDLVLRGKNVFRLHEDKVTPFREDGEILYGKDPKLPMTMEEWISGLATDAPHLFEENKGGGSEPGGRGAASAGRIVLTRDQARDVSQWRDAQARAEKTGAQLVVQD
jgi:hypothetical protein